jgi:hypothetical protein
VNAGAAVTLAQTWTLVNEQTGLSTPVVTVSTAIPDNSTVGITSYQMVRNTTAGLPSTIEQVTLYMSITHPYMGDLRITLTSPSGTVAVLMKGAQVTRSITQWSSYALPARLFCKSFISHIITCYSPCLIAGVSYVYVGCNNDNNNRG